ncbi:MAG: sigma-70 family RNA polymerase sigma factor [Planctomyces sp.]|nr:sigma-70 family RNA polymerase sigma factor [Planctomyces sp.]
MSQGAHDSAMRNLSHYQYQRNRHLTAVHDAEDLFQDAWIHLNEPTTEPASKSDLLPEEQRVRMAVTRASERIFGKLRKRCSRGTAAEVQMEYEPADCLPDPAIVLDLRIQIEQLPAEERLVIEMIRCGYEGTEIARQLKVSPQSVTRRKQKAIKRLRQTLGEER